MRTLPALLVVAACSSPAAPTTTAPRDAIVPKPITTEPSPGTADTRRWFAGDVHMHVRPPDDPSEVVMGVAEIAQKAREAKLDFVVLTPHVWPGRRGAAFNRQWREMAALARATPLPTLIPGVEWTTVAGHFAVAGVDVTGLEGEFLPAAHAAGAFISVNHPFAVPSKLPLIRASHFDMSYKAWTAAGTKQPIDGVEVWNVPLAMGNVIARPGGRTGEELAWTAADRVIHAEHRRLTAVGGTDNHNLLVMATTWVLAADAGEAAILDALRAGATCVGGTEAGSLRARGDDGTWVRVGGIVQAATTLTLAWDGLARLFIDGLDTGEHAGGFRHATNGVLHTYRLVAGSSRCGFLYANL
ncbi:MAG: hypothetical protein ABI867_28780 [Kofleriaceae bacterium]